MMTLFFMNEIKRLRYIWHAFSGSLSTDDRYRRGVGIVLIDGRGCVFMAQKHITRRWQFPQGGLDAGEEESTAAWREMYEETGVQKARLLGQTRGVYRYLVPWYSFWRLRFKGQSQRWFLFLCKECDEDIHLNGEAVPEFSSWRWVDPENILEVSDPKRRDMYAKVLEAFAPLMHAQTDVNLSMLSAHTPQGQLGA